MKLKIQNIPFIPLYESNLLPVLKPLAAQWSPKGRGGVAYLIPEIDTAKKVTIDLLLLTVIFFLVSFFLHPLLFFSVGCFLFSFVGFGNWWMARNRLAVFTNVLDTIMRVHFRWERNLQHILLMGSIEEIGASISKVLVDIAEWGLASSEIKPQCEEAKECDAEFKLLHNSAEAIGFDFGPFKPFYDSARMRIEGKEKAQQTAPSSP